jgi:hypothetical protein
MAMNSQTQFRELAALPMRTHHALAPATRLWLARLSLLALASLLWAPVTSHAALPEPYNLVFGNIEMDGRLVTSADTDVTVEARRLPVGATIATYRMGSQASAGDYYALKIRLESPAPDDILKAAETGTTLYITVLNGAIVKNQLEYDMGARGAVMRLDFGDVDTDTDGLPDGWEQAYLLGLYSGPNDDPDHDGLVNADEYRVGTHPRKVDAPHPADLTPRDNRITIAELSAYYKAWKKGEPWSLGPSPLDPTNTIHIEYVTRASTIWEAGEYYRQDITVTNGPPLWWVSIPPPGGVGLASTPPADTDVDPDTDSDTDTDADADAARARRSRVGLQDGGDELPPLEVESVLPEAFVAQAPAVVLYRVTVRPGLRTYAVEDAAPTGWRVEAISAGGSYDATNRVVKWGPFFDRESRELSYTVVPDQVTAAQAFVGVGSYDGRRVAMTGRRTVAMGGTVDDLVRLRFTSDLQQWSLTGRPGLEYAVEYSEDLVEWRPLTNGTADALGGFYFVPHTLAAPQSYFRALQLPPGAAGEK